MKYFILNTLLLISCGRNPCYYYTYDWGFDYSVEPNITTKYDIQVDDSEQNLGSEVFDMIDTMTQEVEQCLADEFPDGDLSEIAENAFCYNDSFKPCVDKECLQVKIPNDWSWNKDGTHQLLQDDAPLDGCRDKGLDDNECKWRGGLQDGYIVITTPNLIIYKDPLIKQITRCDNVWYEPRLAKCASPGVDPRWNEK